MRTTRAGRVLCEIQMMCDNSPQQKRKSGAMCIPFIVLTALSFFADISHQLAGQQAGPSAVFDTDQHVPSVQSLQRKWRVFTRKSPIPIPSMVKGYNRSMGGADLHDQLVQLYRTMIKTLAWQTRIFTQILHSSVVNAHVLYTSYYNLEKNDDGYTLLIKDMCDVDSKKRQREAAARPPMCFPVRCPRFKKEAKDTRRWCIQCKKRKSVVECRSCNVALCIGDRGCAEKSCWQLYHEAKAVKSSV